MKNDKIDSVFTFYIIVVLLMCFYIKGVEPTLPKQQCDYTPRGTFYSFTCTPIKKVK